MKAGQDQMWTMSNVTVQHQAEILDTLVLRYLKDMGLMGYSIGTAMGIFQAFIGLALFIVCNYLAKAAKSDSII
jgi:putative aldouronate transport system permease protein